MQLPSHKLIGLPVETRSGQRLGTVRSFTVDTTTQAVTYYSVGTGLVPRFIVDSLSIAAAQVISLTPEKMVVYDAVLPRAVAEPAPSVN